MRFKKENHRGILGNPFDRDYFDRENIIDLDSSHFSNVISIHEIPASAQARKYDLEISLPGFKREEIAVSIDEGAGTINIVAQKSKPKELSRTPYFIRREYSLDALARDFELPEHVDIRDIRAHYELGILSIRLPHKGDKPVGRGAA